MWYCSCACDSTQVGTCESSEIIPHFSDQDFFPHFTGPIETDAGLDYCPQCKCCELHAGWIERNFGKLGGTETTILNTIAEVMSEMSE